MLKKIKNLLLTLVLIMSLMPMVMVFADEYREKIVLGGNTSGTSYDYSTPAVKQVSSQDILLICEGAVYNHPQYSLKTCKVLPQSCAYQVGTSFADSQCSHHCAVFKVGRQRKCYEKNDAGSDALWVDVSVLPAGLCFE